MSRKGKLPIPLPQGVEVKVSEKNISVKGPKGTLNHTLIDGIQVQVESNQIVVSLDELHKKASNFHGLYRSIINNMVVGTSQGFERKLEMIGVGYRAAVQGQFLDVQIGLSHPMKLEIPEGVSVRVDKNTNIIISGTDKQKIGQFAATIRSKKKPEPYQGKGIRYQGEYVRKKAGKSAAKK